MHASPKPPRRKLQAGGLQAAIEKMGPSGELFEFKAAFKAAREVDPTIRYQINCAPEGGYAGGHGEGGAAVRLSSAFAPIHMLAVFFAPDPIVIIQFSDETPLDQIDLPSRLRNALEIEGVNTVGEVRNMADADLLSFQNLGAASVRHLRQLFGASRSDPRRKGRGGG